MVPGPRFPKTPWRLLPCVSRDLKRTLLKGTLVNRAPATGRYIHLIETAKGTHGRPPSVRLAIQHFLLYPSFILLTILEAHDSIPRADGHHEHNTSAKQPKPRGSDVFMPWKNNKYGPGWRRNGWQIRALTSSCIIFTCTEWEEASLRYHLQAPVTSHNARERVFIRYIVWRCCRGRQEGRPKRRPKGHVMTRNHTEILPPPSCVTLKTASTDRGKAEDRELRWQNDTDRFVK